MNFKEQNINTIKFYTLNQSTYNLLMNYINIKRNIKYKISLGNLIRVFVNYKIFLILKAMKKISKILK